MNEESAPKTSFPKAGKQLLEAEKAQLAKLLEAIQRCGYFLHVTSRKLPWPLEGKALKRHRKDEALFQALAAFNERFAKLQDVLGAAMRHAFLLHGENPENFLKVLAWYEKQGVVDSIETWQILRTIRNLAAHEYEIDYEKVAEHFNALHEALPVLYRIAVRFLTHCQSQLRIGPASQDFGAEFEQAVAEIAQA